METSFYVRSTKLDETKQFIRTLSTARFLKNPVETGSQFRIELSLSVEDGNKLSKFLQENNKVNIEIVQKRKTVWRKIVDFLLGEDDEIKRVESYNKTKIDYRFDYDKFLRERRKATKR